MTATPADVTGIETEQPLVLRRVTGEAGEMAALQQVLEGAPGYFRLVFGAPAAAEEAQSLCTVLPPGKDYDQKFVWGLYAGSNMIGCADVIRGWNAPHKAMIGLLLLAERWQGRGLGRVLAQLVETKIAAWPEIRTLRIGVARDNPALAFWREMGYVPTGEVKPAEPPLATEIEVLEKPLARSR